MRNVHGIRLLMLMGGAAAACAGSSGATSEHGENATAAGTTWSSTLSSSQAGVGQVLEVVPEVDRFTVYYLIQVGTTVLPLYLDAPIDADPSFGALNAGDQVSASFTLSPHLIVPAAGSDPSTVASQAVTLSTLTSLLDDGQIYTATFCGDVLAQSGEWTDLVINGVPLVVSSGAEVRIGTPMSTVLASTSVSGTPNQAPTAVASPASRATHKILPDYRYKSSAASPGCGPVYNYINHDCKLTQGSCLGSAPCPGQTDTTGDAHGTQCVRENEYLDSVNPFNGFASFTCKCTGLDPDELKKSCDAIKNFGNAFPTPNAVPPPLQTTTTSAK